MGRHAILLTAILLGFALLSFAQAPVPLINLPLVPDATPPGGSDFTLTINGTGFVSNSTVNWNGTALVTQFVSQAQLTATVPAADIATASTGWVTVVNPEPGGGTSNTAFFTVIANEGNSVAFALASSPSVGQRPFSVAVGDFNGDGKLDLAVANGANDTVSILLGDGIGNFSLISSPAVGSNPASVTVGDFKGDGIADLAVANEGSNDVSILVGDGTGNFTLASSPAVGTEPYWVAAGDFNGDGKLDLAVANCGSGGASILLGDGTGSFTFASSPPTGSCPKSLAVGDFNGDGKLDLAVANDGSDTVSILLGDGAGDFNLVSTATVGSEPTAIAAGDFNGDGKLDLATGDWAGGVVSVLLGDGTGNFTRFQSISVGGAPTAVAVGDFNGDGNLDIAVVALWNTLDVLLGNGKGGFSSVPTVAVGTAPESVAIGDFNGDGEMDLVTANQFSNTVSVVLQVPGAPAVTLSPGSITFGAQLFDSSSNPQPVTLTNSGGALLKISKIAVSTNFSQTNNCPSNLAPSAQCTIDVTFTPHNVGTLNGKLAVYDNAPNSPQTVPLTGVGTAVTLLPSNLNFGNQQVGTTSQPQTITLTNYAPKPVKILGSDFTGNNPGSFAVQSTTCAGKLPAGESCTANITFTPKSKGSKSATFNVNDNAGNSPQTVSLSGNGT